MHTPAPRFARVLARAAALALILASGAALAPAVAASAADGDVTWTVRTAANNFGADRTSFSYTVNPGATVSDAMVVANRGTTALDLGVYAADGYTTDSGQFDLLVGGEKSVAIGTWVASGQDRVTVGPGESVEIPFTLTVPENATPGDYAGGILTSLVEPGDTAGINVDRRLGIRIALRVGGDLEPALAIEGMRVDWSGGLNPFAGDATIAYSIRNTGNAVLDAQQTAGVSGPFGLLSVGAGAMDAPPRLLPGESWDVTVPLHNVAATLLLAATATVTPVLVDASGSTTALEPVVASVFGLAVPWVLLIVVVAAVIIIVVASRVRRHNRAARKQWEDARVRDAVQAALRDQELARSTD